MLLLVQRCFTLLKLSWIAGEKLQVEILDVAHMEIEKMEILGGTLLEDWMKKILIMGHDDWETNASWVSTAYNICLLRDELRSRTGIFRYHLLRKWGMPKERIRSY